MKIVIDLQACQTPDSRRRGIGRYSLEFAKAIVRNRGSHLIHFLLNDAYCDTDDALNDDLRGLPGATLERYRLIPFGPAQGGARRSIARLNDEILNWRYACSGADALHVSSVFEGWLTGDAHVSGKMADVPGAVRSATLYDLIPLLFDQAYLAQSTRGDYLARLNVFHQLDLVFTLSDSARLDAIRHLSIPPESIVKIGAAVTGAFHPIDDIDAETRAGLLSRLGLGPHFILYTGGIDHRKNIDFLLRSYAALPLEVRRDVQLVIVCDVSPEERVRLLEHCVAYGIADQTVFTGFVADEDLNLLYNLCELFVFPSLYEGFGLPLLEAMTCGACVIASNTSSMPEIVGAQDLLFDPADSAMLTRMMHALLSNRDRRRHLAAANLQRARAFSWDNVAQAAISGIEDAHARRRMAAAATVVARRPRVALFAPLPPKRTGVADYCAAMLPFWNRHFDVGLVVDGYAPDLERIVGSYPVMSVSQFRQRAHRFDSILYHFGNSPYHAGMYALLPRYPGIVVFHDFFLSGLVQWLESADDAPGLFHRELAIAHGAKAVLDIEDVVRGELAAGELRIRYPVSRRVVQHAQGLIFHSEFARRLAVDSYSDLVGIPSTVVPQAAFGAYVDPVGRPAAREALGLAADALLVCAFGFLVETKDNELLLQALSRESLAANARLHVAFVGELEPGPWKAHIERLIACHPMRNRITITGYVDEPEYVRYLAACDIGVSVRCNSRGETSAAMQRQLAAGCATIVSDYAAMRELPDEVALKVPPSNADALARALRLLADDPTLRGRLGTAARRWIDSTRKPAVIAGQYAAAIASLTALERARSARRLSRRIAEIADDDDLDCNAIARASEAIAAGLALHPSSGRWLP